MITELVVLLRIEDLEQGSGRVAAEVGCHLVDLVEEENRVDGRRLAHHLDDLPGEGADIGAAVSPNLGLVAHAAERESDEVAPGGVPGGPTKHRMVPVVLRTS